MYIISYLLIGLVLSYLFCIDGDRRAITHFGFMLFITLLWPLVLAYAIHATLTKGVIRYKGKEIWRAKGARK